MEISKNKTVNVVLLSIVLPIVVTIVSTVIIERIKANGQDKKAATQPLPKVPVTNGEQVTVTQNNAA